jgi:hypothetical protein
MAVRVTSGTTTANTVTTVTFANWYGEIEVVNRSTNDMWARFDGIDPTIAGDECSYVPPESYLQVANPSPAPQPGSGQTGSTTVKIISASAATYTVSGGM